MDYMTISDVCFHSYLYVLQICTDIRENRILVDGDDASHLASLLLQGTSHC